MKRWIFVPLWVAAGVVLVVAFVSISVTTAALFYYAYGNPSYTYTGQSDDKHGAWLLLSLLVILAVIIQTGFVLPFLRIRNARKGPGRNKKRPSR